ncbi:phosphonate C-P lyase system protein PhnH [Pseudonocardia sp. CNS-139]|nr:phosphonate C-P lyase system protein PhnH [Pseudonocardia sp. CNS-139]
MTAAGLAPLDPDTAQRTFRAVLDALARPGTVHRLPAGPGVPAALLPTLALADLDTPVAVLTENPDPADAVATATTAPVTDLPAARLVAALRPLAAGELGTARTGSAAAPEDAALVTLAVPALDGGAPLRISGPGIAGTRTLAPVGVPADLAAARAGAAFPAGADLLLVTPDGQLLGLPRSTRIEED